MAIPHFINDDKSEMRGIGNLSSGPFASRDLCLLGVRQPTNEVTKPHPRPK
jgi:hypothetical protein